MKEAHMESPSAPAEAASAPAPVSASDKAADFENYLFDDEDEQDNNQTEEDEGELEDGELELDDGEEDGEEGEPEKPAIPAPTSLTAEEKTVFAQLPAEAQAAWAASENRRNGQVQEATTKAATREREAQAAIERASAEAAVHYAAQLKTFADAFRPQMPDPQLATVDPMQYIAAKAQYDAQSAQFAQIEQQIAAVRDDAFGSVQELDHTARAADLMTVPELANPETRIAHIQMARDLVAELGIDPDVFEQNADSGDFKAVKIIAGLKEKADKYDAAMSRKMQRVRAGKPRTMRPAAAPTDNSRAVSVKKSWERVRATGGDKTARADAFADFLEASGHL